MKKILLVFAAICAFAACNPTHESISNDGHITADELKAKSSVTVNIAPDGKTGNLVTCTTSAPVNAKWTIAGKDMIGNYATKKMKLGAHNIVLTGLCADGTVVTAEFPVVCEETTDPLQRFYIYGEDPAAQPPFKPVAWNAACMRFSDNEGKFVDINGKEGFLPYLSDDVYWGLKTLIFDITECTPDANVKIMTGWWSPVFFEDYNLSEALEGKADGLWELQLTEDIAKACARGNGGDGRDLDLMFKSGGCQINAVYYEE